MSTNSTANAPSSLYQGYDTFVGAVRDAAIVNGTSN